MDNTPTFSPTPDPAFTAALEWQLRRELRRDTAPTTVRPRPKTLTLVAVALTSALAGAACLSAAMQVQESRRGQIVITSLTLREGAARQSLQVARKAEQTSEAMLNAGRMTPTDARRAATRVAVADAALRIIQLDLAEARASSRAPRRDLSAPTVGGRDFVLERLRIEQEQADITAAGDAALLDISRKRTAAGFQPLTESASAELNALLSRQAAEDAAARITLRQKFIAGDLTAEQTERRHLHARAKSTQTTAQAKLTAAQTRLSYITKRSGIDVSTLEVSEAQLTVTNLQVDLDIANAELEALATPI